MAYLDNSTRISSITVNGTDVTSSFISFSASDASGFKNGAISTQGDVVLGSLPGGYDIQDYDRDIFKRGSVVIIDLVDQQGNVFRHPRGYLYVLSTNYLVESEELEIQVGCRLSLMALTEETGFLYAMSPVYLDVAQRTFSNISAAFASASQIVWQDNTGALQTATYFDGDDDSQTSPGLWVSVLGATTHSTRPLAGFEAIPDQIKLSYQIPIATIGGDNTGYVETSVEESRYFTAYPSTMYVRNQRPATEKVEVNISSGTSVAGSSGCGNSPAAPNGSVPTSVSVACIDLYDATQQSEFIPATRVSTTKSYYSAAGSQISRIEQETTGMPIEANSQYYGDKFAYCRAVAASRCNPNGQCPMEGTESVVLSRQITTNEYGEANELVRTIVDSYATTLSAAQPFDWRAGNVGGVPQSFNQDLDPTTLYRATRQETVYYQEGKANVQYATTWTSMASRGIGINAGSIDALDGIKTTDKRTSTTTAVLDIAPDRLNAPVTPTREESTTILLGTASYMTPPPETGPYILEEQVPVPLLVETQAEVDTLVADYSRYLVKFTKGDIYGIQVGESLRSEIATGWTPNMPFRYYDAKKNKLSAMRMDQTSWSVDGTSALMVTSGMWIGESNGTVVIPSNLVGNSLPDMGNGSTPPPGAGLPPYVENETIVDTGRKEWIVNVDLGFGPYIQLWGNNGVVPPPLEGPIDLFVQAEFSPYVTGLVVGPGSLIAPEPDGSIPYESGQGQLITEGGTVVTSNLFG